VATRVGGLVDAVEDGVTGLLMPAGDARGLRHDLAKLLNNPQLRGHLGEEGRQKACKLNWDAAVDQLTEALRFASGGGRRL
jgi:glycosyltransferase involved in cell wall biosynthesis